MTYATTTGALMNTIPVIVAAGVTKRVSSSLGPKASRGRRVVRRKAVRKRVTKRKTRKTVRRVTKRKTTRRRTTRRR